MTGPQRWWVGLCVTRSSSVVFRNYMYTIHVRAYHSGLKPGHWYLATSDHVAQLQWPYSRNHSAIAKPVYYSNVHLYVGTSSRRQHGLLLKSCRLQRLPGTCIWIQKAFFMSGKIGQICNRLHIGMAGGTRANVHVRVASPLRRTLTMMLRSNVKHRK